MNVDTSVARAVRTSESNGLDAACKRLLSEQQILSRIMHDWVDGFGALSPAEIEERCFEGEPRVGEDPVDRDDRGVVRALNGEDTTVAEGRATFDIRFEAWAPRSDSSSQEELVCVELDVEAQNDFNPGYSLVKRGIYYAGRMLSLQGGDIVAGSRYERVRRVVSVWVCAHPPVRLAGTVTSFVVRPSVLVGDATYAREEYDLVQVLMACLNDRNPGSSKGALGMLEILLSADMTAEDKLGNLSGDYGIIVTKRMSERVVGMCNLSKGYIEEGYNRGMEKGMERGMEKGMERGMERGKAEARSETLRTVVSLVRDGILGLADAADRFGFSEQELSAAL